MRVRLNVSDVNFQLINYEQTRFESIHCIVVLLRVNDSFAFVSCVEMMWRQVGLDHRGCSHT